MKMPSDCPVKADRRSTFHPAHASKDRSTATPNAIQLQAVNAATTTQLNLGRLRTINAFNRSKLTPPFIRAPNQVPSRQLNTFGSLSASTRNPRRPTDAIDHADAYYRLRGIESKALRALNEEVFHEYSGLTLLNDFTDRLHFHCRELVFDLKKDAVGCDIREIPIEEFTESILQISLDSSTVRNVMEAVSINEKHVKEAWSIRSSQSIAQKQPKQQESPLEESTHKTLLASPGSSAAVNEMADLSIKSPQANPGNAHEQPKLQGNLLEERSENAQFTSPAPSAALKETDASSIEPPQDKADYAQEQTEQQEKQRKKQQKKNQKKKQKKQQECPIMQFVSLGMLIIGKLDGKRSHLSSFIANFADDIHHSGPHPPMLNILGGAGTYATLGARLFCIPEHFMRSPNLGYVVHAGTDFGKDVRSEVESWKTGSRVIETPERLTYVFSKSSLAFSYRI